LCLEHDAAGEILNIGAGAPISLTALAKLILKITNKEYLKIEYTEPRLGDILHSYADISNAKKLINFEPQYNQEEGLKDYFKWYYKRHNIEFKID